MRRLDHVLITGAAGTIGAALADRFAEAGAELTLWDVDMPRLESVSARHDSRFHRVDMTDLAALGEHFAAADAERPVDVLINCAGVMDVYRVDTHPWDRGHRLMEIDLLAPLRLMQLAAAAMAARRSGTIVNISSMAGLVPLKGCAFYGAAKAGLAMASEIARAELRRDRVSVVTVYPGAIHSPLESGARAQWAQSRWQKMIPSASADGLAGAVLEACQTDSARVIYPRPLRLLRAGPGLVQRFSARFGPAARG